MRWIIFLGTLMLAACSQAPDSASPPQVVAQIEPASSARGSLSPAAPVNLSYQVESSDSGQPQRIDLAIRTHLKSGSLLIEVAKQEGAAVIGASMQRIDLAAAAHPIALQMQATLLGSGEHYLVLLLTVETDMGPMSRSFRIDLAPTGTSATP